MASGARFEWKVTPEKAFSGIPAALSLKQRQAVFMLFQYFAPQVENWLRENAPWTDQTGALRVSLFAEVQMLTEQVVLKCDYGLQYGIYLEFGHAGHYAIIAPAVDYWFPIIWEAATKLLGLKSGGGVVRPTRE